MDTIREGKVQTMNRDNTDIIFIISWNRIAINYIIFIIVNQLFIFVIKSGLNILKIPYFFPHVPLISSSFYSTKQ